MSERVVERTFYSKCKELTFLVKAKPTFASFTIANELLLLPLQYRAFTALAIAIAEAPFCSSTAMYCQKGCYIYQLDRHISPGRSRLYGFFIKPKQLVHFVRSNWLDVYFLDLIRSWYWNITNFCSKLAFSTPIESLYFVFTQPF